MSYRKDKNNSLEWSKCKKRYGQKLLQLGIPECISESESRWWHFLEHGYDYDSDWEPSHLNQSEAPELLDFLKGEYSNGEA